MPGWVLKERETGNQWRYPNPTRAWEAAGYDTKRFVVEVIRHGNITGAPDGYPPGTPLGKPSV